MTFQELKENRSDLALTLQVVLDDCARNLDKLHDWAESTTADRDSYTWGTKDGAFDAHLSMAYYVIGVAHTAGVELNCHRFDRATARGDFL